MSSNSSHNIVSESYESINLDKVVHPRGDSSSSLHDSQN